MAPGDWERDCIMSLVSIFFGMCQTCLFFFRCIKEEVFCGPVPGSFFFLFFSLSSTYSFFMIGVAGWGGMGFMFFGIGRVGIAWLLKYTSFKYPFARREVRCG